MLFTDNRKVMYTSALFFDVPSLNLDPVPKQKTYRMILKTSTPKFS